MEYNLSENQFNHRKYLRYFLYSAIILLFTFFLLRNSIVRTIFNRKCVSIKNRYGIFLAADNIGFSDIRTIYVEGITAIPNGKDTLFRIKHAAVKLKFTDLLLLRINPLEVWVNNAKISFLSKRDGANYSFQLDQKKGESTSTTIRTQEISNQTGYQYEIYRALKAVFGLTTAKYHVRNFLFSYYDSAYSTLISVPNFESNEKGFDTQINLSENGIASLIRLNGKADKKSSDLSLVASRLGARQPLPLLYHKWGINLSFDTLNLRMSASELNSNSIKLKLTSSAKSLELFSERVSDQTIRVNRGGFDFDISINPDYYQLDSTSTINLNGLTACLFLKYYPSDNRYVALNIRTGEFKSQRLFDALPEGLFTNLNGIRTKGTMDFSLDFNIRLNVPDSVHLKPTLITSGFGIDQFGYSNFSSLKDTFSHDVYVDGQFIKTIHIGSSNKEFRAIDKISPLIIDAVITSEDGGFYNNNGFDVDAFKYAITQNVKHKRFARGGSTITMQLIKNLYLNKNKNLFRKAEEYLIVWLIESQGIVTKERLLEIYLNIIEWGPDIYGVEEACQYYYKKDAKDITLDEAIYLACVIPRPQKFKYLFEKDGNLKSFMEEDFSFVANKMFERGMITEEQLNDLKCNVSLTGRALDELRDTTLYSLDSISLDEINIARDSTLLLP
jgi:hypothetical protein